MRFSRTLLGGASLVLAATVTAAAAAAQDTRGAIVGVVQGAGSGHGPIANASVSVPALGRYVVSDSAGRFRLAGIRPGTYRLEVRAIGYQPVGQVAELGADSVVVSFVLKAAAVTLPEMVSSVSREEQLTSSTPLSVGVVREEDIQEARAHHPAEIVNRVPGVYVSNFGGEGHATAIRQPITTKALYAYLEDGVPIRSTGFFNHNALYEINLPQAGRIEVIKGPGSAVYGSDAVGGVVNAFTRQPSARPEAQLFLEGGSNTYRRMLGSASTTSGRHGIRADLNITTANGWRQATPYDRQSGSVRWDYHLGHRGMIKTVATFSHINQPGDGGSDLPDSTYTRAPSQTWTPIAYRRVTAARLSSEFQMHSDLSSFGATVYARYNTLDLLPSWQLSFDPQIWASEHRSIGVLSRWRRTIAPLGANLSAGLDLEYSPGSRLEQKVVVPVPGGPVFDSYSLGEVQYDYDVAFWQMAPYAQAEIALPGRVHLSAGVRYDHLGYDYDNQLTELTAGRWRRPSSTDVTFNRVSPKLGATWAVAANATLFASYREAFRAPSESQLFRQGAAVSTVDLKPVRAHSWEAGLRTALNGIATFEATVYRMRLNDDILTFVDPSNNRLTQNAGATNHQGIEIGAGVAPVRGIQLDAAVSYARHTYVTWTPSATADYSGNAMELAPKLLGNIRATYRPAFLETGFVSVEWTRTGSYWMDAANSTDSVGVGYKYGGHHLFNAYATVPVTGRFELSGRVTNIGNKRFAETSSYTPQQFDRYRPGAPRQFFLGAQYRLW